MNRSGYRPLTWVLKIALVVVGLTTLFSCLSAADLTSYLATIPVTKVNFGVITDGVYAGSYTVALPPGANASHRSVSVRVNIGSGRAQAIEIVDPATFNTNAKWRTLINRVIGAQSLQVDAITGASVSSKAFFKAVENAISPHS